MSEAQGHAALVVGFMGLAPVIFLSLLFLPAPYGRHARPGWGPTMDGRGAWILMESPSVFAYLFFHLRGPRATDAVPLVFLLLWQAHYVNRALLEPLRGPRARMPVAIAAMSFAFNVANSYMNATWFTSLGPAYPASWLRSPAFLSGLGLFLAGAWINREADRRLRELRAAGGYAVPHGWLFDHVSCPNYLGEIVEWAGWAILTWSPAGLAFALFTLANLAPRALTHHRWYRARFPGYPAGRRALVPLLLTAILAAWAGPASAQEGDAWFARRAEGAKGSVADPAPVDRAVAAYRAELAAAPGDLTRLAGLLRALHFRGAYCATPEETKRRIFDEGRRTGQAAIDELEKRARGKAEAERLALLRGMPGAAGVYYWTAAHWGEWALGRGKFAAAKEGVAGRVRDLAQTVADLDPSVDEGGGLRVLGRLHHQAPRIPFITGWVSKKKALEYLRGSHALGPESRMTWLFLAEALLDHESASRAEALALLERGGQAPPRPDHAVEDAHYSELARAALRAVR
jgi:3-oxo-5-alpha-steroid 4-dehydrogenase 1